MRFKGTLAILILALSACSSSSTNSIDNATLEVVSDCVTPAVDVTIRTSNGTSISGTGFGQLGFPVATIHLGQDNSGLYNNGLANVTRVCRQTYGAIDTNQNNKYIFSCFDDGAYACSITLISL